MAASRSITAETLAALGAPRLAAALIEHAEADPVLRKKLRMLLAGTEGPGRLAAELGKRIQTIGRSRSAIDWDKHKTVAQELDHIRLTIGTTLASQSPAAAIERMWEFVGIADPVLARIRGGYGEIEEMFVKALEDLGRLIAADPHRDTASLARRVLAMCESDGFAGYAATIQSLSEALGTDGRAVLRRETEAALAALPPPKPMNQWGGEDQRRKLVRRLMTLADLDHDPDAYIAAVRAGGMDQQYAGEIANRLNGAGRPAEALQWLDQPRGSKLAGADDVDTRIAALAALGRTADVQALRWAAFEQLLSAEHLRAYLKALPDFEDFDAEQKALAIASGAAAADLALAFLIEWPALDRAAALVRDRIADLDGADYDRLRPAAQALEPKYPEAATMLYRHLAESVLDRSSFKQYKYAAQDLFSAMRSAANMPPGAGIEDHTHYLARLRKQHSRKAGFWALVDQVEVR